MFYKKIARKKLCFSFCKLLISFAFVVFGVYLNLGVSVLASEQDGNSQVATDALILEKSNELSPSSLSEPVSYVDEEINQDTSYKKKDIALNKDGSFESGESAAVGDSLILEKSNELPPSSLLEPIDSVMEEKNQPILPKVPEAKEINLIRDGNFEAGGGAWNNKNGGQIDLTTSYGEGSNSGIVPAGSYGHVGQVVSVEPNTKYIVKAYAKIDRAKAYGFFTGRWYDNSQQGTIIETANNIVVDSSDWKEYSYTFDSGNHTAVLIQIVKWADDDNVKNANLYIDNVSLFKETEVFPPKNPYKLYWKDDFNESSLNLDNWGYELGCIRGIEQQHYVKNSENVFLRNGHLILRATNRPVSDQYFHPREKSRKVIYNSGSIRTHGKVEFLYARLEIRAKLPKGKAVFPAFWTLGADFRLDGKIAANQGRGWPQTGEIDIMELTGDEQSGAYGNRTVYQTLHYDVTEDDRGKYAGHGTSYSLSSGNFNDEFHTFAIDWYKDHISWLVDDKIVRTVNYSDDPVALSIFNRPQYVQLNLALGGSWPGVAGNNLDGTEFDIDYISYSKNSEQELAASEYYKNAPVLYGVKDITIKKGTVPDLVAGLSTSKGYMIDYSIDNEYTFRDIGGNSHVNLLIKGVSEKEKLADLPSGIYNIHYSAIPQKITYSSYMARRTAKLIVVEEPGLNKTITRTIQYVNEVGQVVSKEVINSVKFTRSVQVNEVTGEVTYSDWKAVNEDTTFDEVKSPVVQGYLADKSSVSTQTVDVSSSDIVEKVVYKKLGSYVIITPDGKESKDQYPNDSTDSTKPSMSDKVVSCVPGYSPVDGDGNPLKPVDSKDLSKGYVLPDVPSDPSKDMTINYKKDETPMESTMKAEPVKKEKFVSNQSYNELPKTGTESSTSLLVVAAVSALAATGLAVSGKKRKEE